MAANALRTHLAEFGFVANLGIANLVKLVDRAFADEALPAYAHQALDILIQRMAELTGEIAALDKELRAWHAENAASQRLAAIPGIGIITATAIAASVPCSWKTDLARSTPIVVSSFMDGSCHW